MTQTSIGITSRKAAPVVKVAAKRTPVKTSSKSVQRKAKHSKKGVKQVTPEQYQAMVAEAAYFIAEKRGFIPEEHAQHWAEAEAQIQAMLKNCN